MADELKAKIKKLAGLSETNKLLSYEMSGYMKDSVRRKIFRESAKHKIHYKKKYSYIDQETSGKFLVQRKADKIASVGYVWGIKAYGQKGSPLGKIDDMIKGYEKANKSMVKAVMDRALGK